MPRIDFRLKTTAQPTGVVAAPLISPTFSGTPSLPTGTTAVTQTAGDTTTKIATTEFVTTALGGIQQNSISQGNSNITVTDAGTGSIALTVDGSSIVTVNASGTSTGQAVSITNNTASTTTSTGALIVTGGVGVGGRINAGSVIAGTQIEATTGDLYISRTSNEYGYVTRPNTAGAKKLQFAVAGGSALDEARLNATSTYMTGSATVASTTNSTSTTSGALLVSGGAGIGNNLFVGGAVNVAGNSTQHRILLGGIYIWGISARKDDNASAFDMFDITGFGSHTTVCVTIAHHHSGGGRHGAYRRFHLGLNGYTDIDVFEDTQSLFGGGNGFTYSRPSTGTLRIRWEGASSFSSSFYTFCKIESNTAFDLTNVGMDSFTK